MMTTCIRISHCAQQPGGVIVYYICSSILWGNLHVNFGMTNAAVYTNCTIISM